MDAYVCGRKGALLAGKMSLSRRNSLPKPAERRLPGFFFLPLNERFQGLSAGFLSGLRRVGEIRGGRRRDGQSSMRTIVAARGGFRRVRHQGLGFDGALAIIAEVFVKKNLFLFFRFPGPSAIRSNRRELLYFFDFARFSLGRPARWFTSRALRGAVRADI
jgi:hypothetical protein